MFSEHHGFDKQIRKKMGPFPQFGMAVLTGRDYAGRLMVGHDDGAAMRLAKETGVHLAGSLPIPVQKILRGQFAEAATGFSGVPLRREGAREQAERLAAGGGFQFDQSFLNIHEQGERRLRDLQRVAEDGGFARGPRFPVAN